MDKYAQIYINKATDNFALYEFLKKNDCFEAWQITAIFYSALCYAKAYLYNMGIPENSINSHDSIKNWLVNETNAKRLGIIQYYEKLYIDSRDARYSIKTISKNRISEALNNYKKVKDLLGFKNLP